MKLRMSMMVFLFMIIGFQIPVSKIRRYLYSTIFNLLAELLINDCMCETERTRMKYIHKIRACETLSLEILVQINSVVLIRLAKENFKS